MKKTQRKQSLVKLKDSKEGAEFISYLEQNGFENVHKVSYENLRVKVLVVDEKSFASTNVTCLAAAANCGIKPISVEEYKSKTNIQNTNNKHEFYIIY